MQPGYYRVSRYKALCTSTVNEYCSQMDKGPAEAKGGKMEIGAAACGLCSRRAVGGCTEEPRAFKMNGK